MTINKRVNKRTKYCDSVMLIVNQAKRELSPNDFEYLLQFLIDEMCRSLSQRVLLIVTTDGIEDIEGDVQDLETIETSENDY